MKKTLWLLLGLTPICFGFFDWSGSMVLLLPAISVVCCLLSAFGVLRGTDEPRIGLFILSLVLAAALLALDFSVAIAVGCSRHPFKLN